MNRTWTLSFVIVAFTAQLWAGKPSAGPPPPSAMLFGTFTTSGEIHEELWFRLASITFTRTMTVPEDGAWLYGDAISNRSFPNTICGKRWIATADPGVRSYVPFFRLGMVPGDVCGPTGYCLACGVRFGGTYTSPRTALVTHAGTHSITVATENGGGMNDAVQLWLAQVNRSDMQNMSIYRARSETDPSPATAAELTGEYFIANSPEEVLVVPKFHHAREFPAGPGLTYTATWDGATASSVEVYTPGADAGDRVLGVAVPKLATGTHKLTVTATLPSGKTYTSNPLEVFVYTQTIYVTVEGTFSAKDPVDEASQFVPGSTFAGQSVDLRTAPQKVDLNILIGRGSSGTFDVKLTNVSRYPGVAMNYPITGAATTPDMDFGDGLAEKVAVPIPKGGAPKVVTLPLYIRDYAASATIEVTMPYRKTTLVTRQRLPLDKNGNGMPDAGWNALASSATGAMNHVIDAYVASNDGDNDPVVSGLALGITGDGLSAAEEYRGFFVRGAHRRLHPLRKDLFLVIDPNADSFDDRVTELPLTIHEIRADEAEGEFGPVVNPNRASVPGTSLQRGLLVRTRFNPPDYQLADGQIVPADFEAWGWTFLQGDNIDFIEHNMASLALVQSPNETLSCEIFDYAFWRHYISYGPNGIRETTVALTDDDYPGNRAIYGGSNRLQSVPNSLNALGDDLQTAARDTVCGNAQPTQWRPLTGEEAFDAYRTTLLHEVAHGIDIDHDRIECSPSIMSDEAALPVLRSLTPNDRAQIRIHRKHN